ncbi:hypothetical protein ACFPAF_17065 [Hymenobacter endophyticus]|uniref:Uncharacterized protein n=1 Tax=Hymenobacter endophyticus TaxID=3076335 RepID=A0ABU3TL62_9BACT|nr:hypothetical protein [Hymenobacter endophyticus]MDU0372116.1 hypothetical protein [Hymenobacter endophyticus]
MSAHPIHLLPLSQCLLHWHLKVDELWHRTPPIEVTRTITRGQRAGVTETLLRRGSRAVCDGAKATGEELLKQYRRKVEKLLQQPFLFGLLVTDTGELTLPSILVDARQLMQKRSLTERTMRNHLSQLLAVGFISRKKWHGRQRSFELWIHPDYVCKTPQNAPETPVAPVSDCTTIASALSTNGTKFPVIKLLEDPKDQTLEIGQCGENASGGISERPFQEAEASNRAPRAGLTAKQGQGGGAAQVATETPPPAERPAQPELPATYAAYVLEAWLMAKALLYAEQRFTPFQEELARQAILRGVYRGFTDQHFDFARYHKGVLRRLELVEKHFTRHAGRFWAPMPWAEMVTGRGYFDWENEQGFKGTIKWLVADQRAEQLARVNRAVSKAIGELKLRRKIELGEKVPLRVPRRLVELANRRTLYHQHIAALEQLGGTLATDKYNKLAEPLLR